MVFISLVFGGRERVVVAFQFFPSRLSGWGEGATQASGPEKSNLLMGRDSEEL